MVECEGGKEYLRIFEKVRVRPHPFKPLCLHFNALYSDFKSFKAPREPLKPVRL